MITISLFGTESFRAIERSIARIENPDYTDLLESWARIGIEDNRAGVMSGTDADGDAMFRTTYRASLAKPTPYRQRPLWGVRTSRRSRQFGGVMLPNNNLPTSVYKTLTGPPLAPRELNSRVITNYRFRIGREGTLWFVEFYWDRVVNAKGQPFLHYHFNGDGQLRRDLRGIRPEGRAKARAALDEWIRLEIQAQTERATAG